MPKVLFSLGAAAAAAGSDSVAEGLAFSCGAARGFSRPFQMPRLLAMDRSHLRVLERLKPAGAGAVLGRFLDYAPELASRDVPDPYYGDGDGFERVLDMIEAASRGLLESLRQRLEPID